MPFVIRWIARSIGALVLGRAMKYARSPQGRATISRNLGKLRHNGRG